MKKHGRCDRWFKWFTACWWFKRTGYKNTFAGYTLSVEIDPGHFSSTTATKGASGDGGNTGAGTDRSGYNYAITGSPIDGLNVGVGYGKEEDGETPAANKQDDVHNRFRNLCNGWFNCWLSKIRS